MNMEGERNSIVVVDDDREMANVMVEVLGAAGYRALAANSGAEALNFGCVHSLERMADECSTPISARSSRTVTPA